MYKYMLINLFINFVAKEIDDKMESPYRIWKYFLITLLFSVNIFYAEARRIRVAFVGDPQVDNVKELDYARNSIYKDLKKQKDIDLIIFLGDIVNDKPGLLAPSVALIDSTEKEWFAVPGNHDFERVKGLPRQLYTWRENIGYVDTAIVRKNIKFILMSNMFYLPNGDYENKFTDSQLAWLDSVVVSTPIRQRIVIATHGPVDETLEEDSLAAIFSKHPGIIAVSGHTHTMSRIDCPESFKLEERIDAGAACGSWWRGTLDRYGIPNARMLCGSPRGYYVATFSRKDYKLNFKNLSGRDQMSASLLKEENGQTYLLINVYAGKMGSDASLHVKELKKDAIPSFEYPAEVYRLRAFYDKFDRKYRNKHKDLFIPPLYRKSCHLWRIDGVSDDLEGKTITVTYKDKHLSIKDNIIVEKVEKLEK